MQGWAARPRAPRVRPIPAPKKTLPPIVAILARLASCWMPTSARGAVESLYRGDPLGAGRLEGALVGQQQSG